jgi:hypothetical protein
LGGFEVSSLIVDVVVVSASMATIAAAVLKPQQY